MPLPPPPAAAAHAHAAPAAVATESKVDAVATPAATNAKAIVGFGQGRGENKIPVPTICDYAGLIDGIRKLVIDSGLDIANVLKVYDATPKSSFPGNKDGRACYNFGNILKNLDKTYAMLHSVRAQRVAGEGKPRVKQSAIFAEKLKTLATALGADQSKLEEVLGKEFMAKLMGKA